MTPTLTLGADLGSYLPVLVVIMMAVGFAVVNVGASLVIGPRRVGGATKGQTYESGMATVGTARKRFNVRFYLIAMVFLVIDVEIVFLYPVAVTLTNLAPDSPSRDIWLFRILFFLFTTIVAYLYGYKKGVFRFD